MGGSIFAVPRPRSWVSRYLKLNKLSATPKAAADARTTSNFADQAAASAARVEAMRREIEDEKRAKEARDFATNASNADLVKALQRLWYGSEIEMPEARYHSYLQAVMTISAVDGKVSEDTLERQWLMDRTMLLGVAQEEMERLFTLDYRLIAVTPIMLQLLHSGIAHAKRTRIDRIILYDSLSMASINNLSLDERVRMRESAILLGLSDDERNDIEEMVEVERALLRRKKQLFLRVAAGEDEDEEHEGSFGSEQGSFVRARRREEEETGSQASHHSFTRMLHASNTNPKAEQGQGARPVIGRAGSPRFNKREPVVTTTTTTTAGGSGDAPRLTGGPWLATTTGAGHGNNKGGVVIRSNAKPAAERRYSGENYSSVDAQRSIMRRHALNRLVYGLYVPNLFTNKDAYAKALLAIVGADGVVSEKEMGWLRDKALILGFHPDRFAVSVSGGEGGASSSSSSSSSFSTSFFDVMKAFTFGGSAASAGLPSEVQSLVQNKPTALAILFDAVTMAAQDGLSSDEFSAARDLIAGKGPVQLGLSDEICDEVVRIVQLEIQLREEKRALFVPEPKGVAARVSPMVAHDAERNGVSEEMLNAILAS